AASASPGLSAATACSGPPSVTGTAPSGGPTNSHTPNTAPHKTSTASPPHSNESRRTSERPPPRHPHRYRIHAHHLHRSNHQLRTEMDLLNDNRHRPARIGVHHDWLHIWRRDQGVQRQDRKSTRLNSSHVSISY